MSKRYTKSFKIQAVKKALSRTEGTTLLEITKNLGISHSTLSRWIMECRKQAIEISDINSMTKEARPHNLSLKDRLSHIISCSSLDEEEINKYCREHGIYPHHIKQWKLDFENGGAAKVPSKMVTETRDLKTEINALKKELNRKDKALAETAALLVLQKKVHAIWGNNEAS